VKNLSISVELYLLKMVADDGTSDEYEKFMGRFFREASLPSTCCGQVLCNQIFRGDAPMLHFGRYEKYMLQIELHHAKSFAAGAAKSGGYGKSARSSFSYRVSLLLIYDFPRFRDLTRLRLYLGKPTFFTLD